MAAKRVASYSDFSENDVKSKRILNGSGFLGSPASLATSDLFEPDEAEETVGTSSHLREEIASSDLFEPNSKTGSPHETCVLSPISSELYEPLDSSGAELTRVPTIDSDILERPMKTWDAFHCQKLRRS